MYIYVDACVCICVGVCMCMYIYMCIFICVHIHIHNHTPASVRMPTRLSRSVNMVDLTVKSSGEPADNEGAKFTCRVYECIECMSV